jgi:uncharacterized protein
MRRKDREMSRDESLAALKKGTWGVLSVISEGEPYGVPLNYYYSTEENAVFFHCAVEGRKLNAIESDQRVSFAVVLSEKIDAGRYTTLYESVIVSGRASIVSDEEEKFKRLKELCSALAPGGDGGDAMINKYLKLTHVVRIDVESISGKTNKAIS